MERHMGQNLNHVHFSLRVSLRVQMNLFSLKVVSLCTLWILQGSWLAVSSRLWPKKKRVEAKESKIRHRWVIQGKNKSFRFWPTWRPIMCGFSVFIFDFDSAFAFDSNYWLSADHPLQLLSTSTSGVGSESEVGSENKDGDAPHYPIPHSTK